jgi:fatty acid desaturase
MMADTVPGEEFRVKARKGLKPQDIKRLTRLSAARSTLSVALNIGLIALGLIVGTAWWTPWVVVPLVVLMATTQHGLMVLSHEAAHYRLYETRWLNETIGRLCGMVVGISMFTYRVVHRLHHNHLYQPNDPDMALMAGYPRGKIYLLKKLGTDLIGLTAHKNYAYFFGAPAINDSTGSRSDPMNDTSPRLRRTARRDRWLVAACSPVLLAVSIATGWWEQYLVLWVLPLLTFNQVILRFRAILEHGAVTDLSSPFTAARTNLMPRWIAWTLFPHNVNFHIEHHLYPSIPHYHLREAHRLLEESGALNGAEVCTVTETFRRVFADRVPATA